MTYYRGDHDFDNGDGGKTDTGRCTVWYDPHPDAPGYGSSYCGRPASSVVHPPDQFRHWCEALEEGRDCMHFEQED